MTTTIIDCRKKLAGTIPSGGHLKPSWFGDLKKEEYEPAMETLDNIWGLRKQAFKVWPTLMKTEVYRVDTDIVVETTEVVEDEVVNIIVSNKRTTVETKSGNILKAPLVIVAAGVWCERFFPEIEIQRKKGVSFRMGYDLKKKPFIKPWAPYKQVVAHQQAAGEIWVGDGSALLDKNWTEQRTKQCLVRCQKALKTEVEPLRVLHGLRPYCKTKDPCLFKRISRSCYVITGAGKSGTIAAGWSANKLAEEVL